MHRENSSKFSFSRSGGLLLPLSKQCLKERLQTVTISHSNGYLGTKGVNLSYRELVCVIPEVSWSSGERCRPLAAVASLGLFKPCPVSLGPHILHGEEQTKQRMKLLLGQILLQGMEQQGSVAAFSIYSDCREQQVTAVDISEQVLQKSLLFMETAWFGAGPKADPVVLDSSWISCWSLPQPGSRPRSAGASLSSRWQSECPSYPSR